MSDIHGEPGDELRAVNQLLIPDLRMKHFVVQTRSGTRPLSQDDRHQSIANLNLNLSVPQDIRVHFDTARNVYLHAWYVYRFHVIAEQHALISLEFALRTALQDAGLLNGKRAVRGLRQLLDTASKAELISNDAFPFREHWAKQLADRRVSLEQSDYMRRNGITTMTFAYEEPVPTGDELDFDWITQFRDSLPTIRNAYAHGSPNLHAGVMRTFEIVWSLINQLFPERDTLSQ